MKSKIPLLILATAIVGSIIQAVIYWPQMPEKMATHFGAGGQPDGWMARTSFVGLTILMQIGLAGMMLGFGRLTRILPTSMINIPNREYWLADERREQTLRETESMMAWIAAGTAMFLLLIFWLTFDANTGEEIKLNAFVSWIAVVVFVVALLGFCFARVAKYYRVPDTVESVPTAE